MLAFRCLHGLPEPALLITAGAAHTQHPRKQLSQTSSSAPLTSKAPTAPRALDRPCPLSPSWGVLGCSSRAEEKEGGGLRLGETRQN